MFGREGELGRLVELIDRIGIESSVAVVTGPAGIGKSSLLRAAIDHARSGGLAVAVTRPTQAEATLGFSALADLVRHLDLGPLDAAPRRLLEITLGLRAGGDEPPTSAQLGVALIRLLDRRAADGNPLVIVVDDLPFLDPATRDVFAFAVRRLPARGVCVLVGERRDDVLSPLPEAEHVVLAPLPAGVIERVVRGALPAAAPDHLVRRLVAVAGGNPLFATELGRTVSDAALQPGKPVPLPPSLGDAVAGRVQSLPARTRESLAAVALLARPTVAALAALHRLGDLGPAELADVLDIGDTAIRFTHPLLASAAHDATTAAQRLALHGELAAVTTGVEQVLHRARGTTWADSGLAAELSAAAADQLARGAAAEAAELATLALDATPSDDPERHERMLAAGEAQFRAGRTAAALATLDELLAVAEATAPRGLRSRALLARATIEYEHAEPARAAELAATALAATDDGELLARGHSILAVVIYDDFVAAAHHATIALRIIRGQRVPNPTRLAQALTSAGATRFHAGEGLDRGLFAEAMVLERDLQLPASESAFGTLAAGLKYADELDESQAMLDALVAGADPGALPYALSHLPQLHLWAGRWDEAESCARRHLAAAEGTQQHAQASQARFNLALVAAHRGDVTEAAQRAQTLADEGRRSDDAWTERNGMATLGFVAAVTGDAPAAVKAFARWDELTEAIRLREPGFARFHGDYVEALVATGDLDTAVTVLDRVGERADRVGRVSAQAVVHRGRALVAAHRGDRDAAFEHAHAALALLLPTPLAYERARSHLLIGIVARRYKDRAAARGALGTALTAFDRMGAASLAERCRRELTRLGGERAPARRLALTPTERSVAELAAAGRTTRQIADALFISPKTVEGNLTRVYRKLGVANRAQLAALLAAGPRA